MNLTAIQSQNKMMGICQLDIAPKLAALLGIDLSLPESEDLIKNILLKAGKIVSKHLTGSVIDPIYSFDLVDLEGQAGTITRLTALSDEVDPLSLPILVPDYGLEEISQNYSLAALELYYHPQEEKALQKKQFLAEVYDYCQYLGIDLLLKLIIYTPADQEFTEESFQADQLQAVQELRKMTDVVALQYPLNPLAAATVTAELDIPWLLISQEQNYEGYKSALRTCLNNGAQGFLAGSSLWNEIESFKTKNKSPDPDQIINFVQTTLKDQLIELMRITDEEGEALDEKK